MNFSSRLKNLFEGPKGKPPASDRQAFAAFDPIVRA
jgi:hypothetical protein